MKREANQMEDSEILRRAMLRPDNPPEWLPVFEAALEDVEGCERINSRDPDNDGKTRVMVCPLTVTTLTAARLLLAKRATYQATARPEGSGYYVKFQELPNGFTAATYGADLDDALGLARNAVGVLLQVEPDSFDVELTVVSPDER